MKDYFLRFLVSVCVCFVIVFTSVFIPIPSSCPCPCPCSYHVSGTPQLFQITKGLLAWPFGPYNSCPTYRKCWFGVLTCGQADLQSMRALIHPHVVERIKEIASISGPIIRALLDPLSSSSLANGSMVNRKTKPMKVVDHLKNYSSHVPLMTRWSIRALRLAMRVIRFLINLITYR